MPISRGRGCTDTWGEGWVLGRAMSVPTGRNTNVIMEYLLGTSQEGPECQEGAGRTTRERLSFVDLCRSLDLG